MLPPDSLRRFFPGTTPLSVLLLATLGMAGWLGWQAVDAATSHVATAEGVLRNYAQMSATELSRYSRANLLDVLGEAFTDVNRFRRGMPSAADVLSEMDDAARSQGCACPALREPIAAFRLTLSDGELEVQPAEGSLSAEARGRIAQLAMSRASAQGPRSGLLTFPPGEIVNRPVAVGYRVVEDDGVMEAVFGFVVDAAALGELFEEWYGERRLLPDVLAVDQPNDSLLYVTVEGTGGLTVFASPIAYPTTLSARSPIGPRFDDLVVQAAVRPEAADQLIIGGLPRSRLPLLTVLLILTLAVGGAAFYQLRREQEFQHLRDDFVSGVSHELRTPLAQIRMFAELQQAGKLESAEDQSRAVRVIHRESKRLSHLVENILQFSRLRRLPGQGMPREELGLEEALADGIDAVTPLLQDRGVRLVVELEGSLSISVNRDALTRIVVNLLDNAAKYGPPGQTVRLDASRVGDMVQLSVSDEGPGVPPSDRERVWKPYRRLERDVKAKVTGSGIGLSVVAQLASHHGGRAWVEEADGGGACFVVELPLAPSAARVAPGRSAGVRDRGPGASPGTGAPGPKDSEAAGSEARPDRPGATVGS